MTVKVTDQWHVASSGVTVAISVSYELTVPVFTVEGLQYGCSSFFSECYCLCTKLYGRTGLSLLSAQCGIISALLLSSSSYLHRIFTLFWKRALQSSYTDVSTKLYGRAGLSLLSAQCGIISALLISSSSYLHRIFTLFWKRALQSSYTDVSTKINCNFLNMKSRTAT